MSSMVRTRKAENSHRRTYSRKYLIDNYVGDATKFEFVGGDGIERTLYQIGGSLNGKQGIFEWIVDPDPTKGVVHRRFIEGVGITGRPNARP